jgi:Na+:H+ antiporter, NhaA family
MPLRSRTDRGPAARILLFALPSAQERRHLADALRTETVGGLVLMAAAVVALVWANSPLSGVYAHVRDFHFGFPALGLDLSVAHWTADGALAVFFFVAGIELKRELVVGELRRPAAAALPVIAALGGMAVPAGLYLAFVGARGGRLDGWAVPMATDIAFALGVLALSNTHLPSGIRAFLLTLAIADDLGAIVVIAVFYTSTLNWAALAGALAGLALFWLMHHRLHVRGWYLYLPLALVIWGLMDNSGIHATVAGVAMGMLLRVRPLVDADGRPLEKVSPAERIGHLAEPVSAGVAVPLFALFAAGVTVTGGAMAEVFREPEPLGVLLGLVAGKFVGVFGGTYLAARFTRARLNPDLAWSDVAGVALLAGIGFTVSLLVSELAFGGGALAGHVKAAVLAASVISALLASALLRVRDARYRRLWADETRDEDVDEVADVDQPEDAVRRPTEARRRADARARERDQEDGR